MRFFDLHCDTLYRSVTEAQDIYKNDFHVSVDRAKNYYPYIGCFAVWIRDDIRGEKAVEFFDSAVKKLRDQEFLYGEFLKICGSVKDMQDVSEMEANKSGIVLTVEGGAVLAGDINRVKYLGSAGVKIMTLTWNGNCELGDGVGVKNPEGLTDFGRQVVQSMEKFGIIVDVSHASEKLFYDVSEIATKPFIATHSNSKKICDNRRNLTDEQFRIIRDRGGVVGITFCKDFLTTESNASFDDILRHVEYFLALGGENTVSIGSDFDGADIPIQMAGIESITNLYEHFLKKGYGEKLLDKIFFDNAYKFMISQGAELL
jgi:membrane dipeptidase